MDVRWNLCRHGWPMNIELPRMIGALTRGGCPFKIGITGDPDQRAYQYDDAYDEMVVLWRTTSESSVRATEWELTDRYWEYCDNSVHGGGGRLEGPPFFLYVVRG